MLYFAYGSNMCSARLSRRVAGLRPMGRAELHGWRLRFHKRSVDASGKCTIFEASGEIVHGALFEIARAELALLDDAEGEGYRQRRLEVRHSERSVSAVTYVARRSWTDPSLRPYDWYLEHVLAGASEHGLPERYVASVLTVSTVPDPDRARERSNRSIRDRTFDRAMAD